MSFNSVSILSVGNDSQATALRAATSKKLSNEAHLFIDHPALSVAPNATQHTIDYLFPHMFNRRTQTIWDDSKDKTKTIKAEGKRLKKMGEYASLVAIMAVAEVVQRPIFSIYPVIRTSNVRALYHQLIKPTVCAAEEQLYVLWCSTNQPDPLTFNLNHLVPVVSR